MSSMFYKGYEGSVELSGVDNCYYGKILGISDLVTYQAGVANELLSAFKEAVDDYLETCVICNKAPNVSEQMSIELSRLFNLSHLIADYGQAGNYAVMWKSVEHDGEPKGASRYLVINQYGMQSVIDHFDSGVGFRHGYHVMSKILFWLPVEESVGA